MISLKSKEEIAVMKEGGAKLSAILKQVAALAVPGASTGDLEALACELISKVGGRPAFKGYRSSFDDRPFPTALCTSINDEVVHGPAHPSRVLKEGDIIGIDIGMEYPFGKGKTGMYTDMAVTVAVGKVSKEIQKLLAVTQESLRLAIEQVKPGNRANDIGGAIQDLVESNGFSVVRDLVGHGVGREVHEDPQIPHFRVKKNSQENFLLVPGMTLAIEPMVNVGDWRVCYAEDNTTIKTADGTLSAHFEHTVAVTDDGCILITE
jgi:methionyl aminopeptidase